MYYFKFQCKISIKILLLICMLAANKQRTSSEQAVNKQRISSLKSRLRDRCARAPYVCVRLISKRIPVCKQAIASFELRSPLYYEKHALLLLFEEKRRPPVGNTLKKMGQASRLFEGVIGGAE